MRKGLITLLTVGLLALCGQAWGQGAMTLCSANAAPRADASSNYVDWWTVRKGTTKLFSVFGYNSGSQQWVQLFDSDSGPTISVTFNSAGYSTTNFACVGHLMTTGDRVVLTNTVGTVTAGIYYVGTSVAGGASQITGTNLFCLYDTFAHAQARGTTGLQSPSGSGIGFFAHAPVHSFTCAATDNFSMIVPVTGMQFAHGLTVATSTTGATYTPGAANAIFTVTFSTQP